MPRFILVVLLSPFLSSALSYCVNAGEKEEELQALLSAYAQSVPEYWEGYRYEFHCSYERVSRSVPERLPILVELTGAFGSKANKDYYHFHLQRVVNRVDVQVTYESGLRTPRDIRFGVNPNPLTKVWEVPTDVVRSRQFIGGVYDHEPWFVPVQQLLDLTGYHPFDRDNLVPLKVLEDGIDERGKRWFAYAPVHLPGAVYIIVFDKTQKWLPVSYRHHYHPLLVDGRLDELVRDLNQLDETKYKEWHLETSVATEWQMVNGIYLPRTIRSVQKTKTADLQAVFEYRNWRIGKEAVADLFDVEKFEKQQFPGEEYFVKIREALGKEGEE